MFGELRVKVKSAEEAVLAATLESDADPENIELLINLLLLGGNMIWLPNNIMN